MPAVDVVILHPSIGPDAGPLEQTLADARRSLGADHLRGFEAAGAATARMVIDPVEDRPFGARLQKLLRDLAHGQPTSWAGTPTEVPPRRRGLVLLGSGSLALATRGDRASFVEAAGRPGRRALANNRFSSDAIALTAQATAALVDLPPGLPGDNALPRWLAEVARVEVTDLRARWRLAVDLDSPLDLLLVAARRGRSLRGDTALVAEAWTHPVAVRIAGLRAVLADRRAELLVAGRTSAASLGGLERHAACRVRALVEERGLRASSRLATADVGGAGVGPGREPRPPRSVLGLLLDRDGPEALGALLAELGDGAAVDTRVLLAHRLGPDESGWPSAEDRFASDLLLVDRIGDPWLRALTGSALRAPIPVVLGGHTLVGPGLRLLAGERGA